MSRLTSFGLALATGLLALTPAGLAAHERAPHVELVRLGDGEPTHDSTLTYGRSPAIPPSRPKPLSL